MTREQARATLSGRELSVGEVWNWHQFQVGLLDRERVRVLAAFVAGATLPELAYFGKAKDEIDELFGFQRFELDNVTMLGLLSATEAALRVDFAVRIADRPKHPVTARFRELFAERGLEQRLEDDLLEAWKGHGPHALTKKAVGRLKSALRLRHWLAHGRYWKPKLGAEYDPAEVFATCQLMLQVIA